MLREWKILLVDDQDYTRQLLRNLLIAVTQHEALKPRKYSYLQANSAMQAKFMFNLYQPELVFLDIDLPDGNGLDVLQKLKIDREHCFIVMVSGISTLENVKTAMSKGAATFIVKPFNGDKILSALQMFDKFITDRNLSNKSQFPSSSI